MQRICVFVFCLVTSPAIAQTKIPLAELTAEQKSIQEQADEAFEAESYEEAFGMFLETLAPTGDKYAQYMVGLMILDGLGTPRDTITGAAWLKLAAERGEENLSEASEAVYQSLNTEQTSQVDEKLASLKADYGDCAVVASLLADDKKSLRQMAGTRLRGQGNSPIKSYSRSRDDKKLDQPRLRKMIKRREKYLEKHCEADR